MGASCRELSGDNLRFGREGSMLPIEYLCDSDRIALLIVQWKTEYGLRLVTGLAIEFGIESIISIGIDYVEQPVHSQSGASQSLICAHTDQR